MAAVRRLPALLRIHVAVLAVASLGDVSFASEVPKPGSPSIPSTGPSRIPSRVPDKVRPRIPEPALKCVMRLEVGIGPRGLPAATAADLAVFIHPNAYGRYLTPSKTWYFRSGGPLRSGQTEVSEALVKPCLTNDEFVYTWILSDDGARADYTFIRLTYISPSRSCVIFDLGGGAGAFLPMVWNYSHRPAECR